MTRTTANRLRLTAAKLMPPLLASGGIFAIFFYGGDAWQGFGLAAVDTTQTVLKYVLGAAAFVSLAVLAERVIQHVVFEGIIASATGTPVPKLLSQISGLLVWVVAISACAGIVFDQDLTVLWAASGVAGLVLGMALRELLQDVFAGIALNIDQAVRIGDFVLLHKAGDSAINGQVLEISWRTTRIKDFFGDVVILPNSKFSSSTITNFCLPEPVSFRSVSITLDARVPHTRAMRVLQAAALEAMTGLVGAKVHTPWVEVKAIKPEGVEYAIFYKAEFRHLGDAKPRVLQAVLTHLGQAGLEPAHPVHERREAGPRDGFQAPDRERVRQLLGYTDVFAGLSASDLSYVADNVRLRVEQPQRVVVQAGEVGTVMYLVIEGLLTLETAARNGHGEPNSRPLRPGDLFDPAVVLMGEAHPATVRTRTPVLLCEVGQETLQQLFAGSPDAFHRIGSNLAALLAQGNRPVGLVRLGASNGNHPDAKPAEVILRQMRHLFPAAA